MSRNANATMNGHGVDGPSTSTLLHELIQSEMAPTLSLPAPTPPYVLASAFASYEPPTGPKANQEVGERLRPRRSHRKSVPAAASGMTDAYELSSSSRKRKRTAEDELSYHATTSPASASSMNLRRRAPRQSLSATMFLDGEVSQVSSGRMMNFMLSLMQD